MLCIRWLFRVARDSLNRADTLFKQREEEKSLIDGVVGLCIGDGGNSGDDKHLNN